MNVRRDLEAKRTQAENINLFSNVIDEAHVSPYAQADLAAMYDSSQDFCELPEQERMFLAYAWLTLAKKNCPNDKALKASLEHQDTQVMFKWLVHTSKQDEADEYMYQQLMEKMPGEKDLINKAKKHDGTSQCLLALQLVTKNKQELSYWAKRLFLLALHNKNTVDKSAAMLGLAKIYEQVSPDIAVHWYKAVAATGNPEAFDAIARYYIQKVKKSSRYEDEVEADKWVLLAAEHGNPAAQLHKAKRALQSHEYKTESGAKILKPEFKTAAKYLRLVIGDKKGNKFQLEAKCLLGLICADPANPEFNYEFAISLCNHIEKEVFEKRAVSDRIHVYFEKLTAMVEIIKKQRQEFILKKQAQAQEEQKIGAEKILSVPYLRIYHSAFHFYLKHLVQIFKHARAGDVRLNPLDDEGKIIAFIEKGAKLVPGLSTIVNVTSTIADAALNQDRQENYRNVIYFFTDLIKNSGTLLDEERYVAYLAIVITLMKDKAIEKESEKDGALLDHFTSMFDGREVCAVTKMAEADVKRCFEGIMQGIVKPDQYSILELTDIALEGTPKSAFYRQCIKSCFEDLDIYKSCPALKLNFNELFKEQAEYELEAQASPVAVTSCRHFGVFGLGLDLIGREEKSDTVEAKRQPEDEREKMLKTLLLDFKAKIQKDVWNYNSKSCVEIQDEKQKPKFVPDEIGQMYAAICSAETNPTEEGCWSAAFHQMDEIARYFVLRKNHGLFAKPDPKLLEFCVNISATAHGVFDSEFGKKKAARTS